MLRRVSHKEEQGLYATFSDAGVSPPAAHGQCNTRAEQGRHCVDSLLWGNYTSTNYLLIGMFLVSVLQADFCLLTQYINSKGQIQCSVCISLQGQEV